MNGRPWTPAEDAILCAHYPRSPARARALLPGRSQHAVAQRASKRGLPRRHAAWTQREDKALRLAWGESPRTILAKLRPRSWTAIHDRAVRVLGLEPAQRGLVSLAESARVLGYCDATLKAILVERGVRLADYHGGEGAPLRATRRYRVDLDDAREAVEAHLRDRASDPRETMLAAARRHGVSHSTVLDALRFVGAHAPARPGCPAAYTREVVDAAMQAWRGRRRVRLARQRGAA